MRGKVGAAELVVDLVKNIGHSSRIANTGIPFLHALSGYLHLSVSHSLDGVWKHPNKIRFR